MTHNTHINYHMQRSACYDDNNFDSILDDYLTIKIVSPSQFLVTTITVEQEKSLDFESLWPPVFIAKNGSCVILFIYLFIFYFIYYFAKK